MNITIGGEMSEIYRVLIIPDTHIPYHDKKTLRAVEKFMADYRWDEYIHLGDLLDFDMISKFNQEMLRNLETRRLLKDYDLANELLDRHQAIVRKNNKNAKFALLEGNHEYRMEVLIDKAPHLEGLLEVDKNLRLKERGIKWVKSWSEGELHTTGKLHYHHGDYVTKHHANKMVENYGVNIAYGHTHDSQTFEKITRGDKRPIKAFSMGHIANVGKLSYTRGKPNNWSQMVGIVEVRENGNFTVTQISIIDHTFSYNGKVYKP